MADQVAQSWLTEVKALGEGALLDDIDLADGDPAHEGAVLNDDMDSGCGGSIAAHLDRVLRNKRSYPVVPTERTQIFTG